MAPSPRVNNGMTGNANLPAVRKLTSASPRPTHDAEMTNGPNVASTVQEERLETSQSTPEQARPTQRRRLSREEWDLLKPLIHRFYIDEGQSLKHVTQILG